jgi:hypothetical protein
VPAFVQYTTAAGAGTGLAISIDLVEFGGEAVPGLKCEPVVFGQVFVASLADLWRMKARAHVVTRPGEKTTDLDDYNWLMRQMVDGEVEYDPVELLEMLLSELEVREHVFSRSDESPAPLQPRHHPAKAMHLTTTTRRLPLVFDILGNLDVLVRR